MTARIEHSTPDRNAVLEEAATAIDQLERTVRLLVPESVRPDTSNARGLLVRIRSLTNTPMEIRAPNAQPSRPARGR